MIFSPLRMFIILALILIALSYFFSDKFKIKQKLKNLPLKSISAVKNNETVKLIGNIESVDKPLIAPISKKECVLYYIHIEQEVFNGKTSDWETIVEERVGNPFFVKEAGNYAYINDSNIQLHISRKENTLSGFYHETEEPLVKILQQKGISTTDNNIRYTESSIPNQEKITVSGKGKWKTYKELKLNTGLTKFLELSSTPNSPIYLTDKI